MLLLFVLCVLFSGIVSIKALAMVFTEPETVDISTGYEFQPMMARACIPPQPTRITAWSQHALDQMSARNMGQDYLQFIYSDAQPYWNPYHGTWNYSDGQATICVTSAGVVTTVYWNYEN